MKDIQIGHRLIGPKHIPFIIAEMSGNHNQSLDRALEIVDAAANAGAHALKLQTYTADTITMKGVFSIQDKNSLWNGKELHDLYSLAYTPWEWHASIFNRAKEKGMLAFSSPFDEMAVDFLESLNVPAYKIASFENTHHPLLRKVAKTGKPIIMSTGVSTLSDIDESVRILRDAGCNDLILLKCTSTYPATPENSNISTIPHMSQLFDCPVGLSDHTMGIGTSVAAVALGATVIEKHFTLKRSDGGVDSAFSLEPTELSSLVVETERAFQSLGKINYGIIAAEEKGKQFKRSIYISRDMIEGEEFTEENLRIIRPGFGLEPKYFERILGKKIRKSVVQGTPLTWDLL
ncbi:MAG: pseudaminic acid synthase [Bacteroidetes bacterium]|nr:pseudaminic acid synthase [Bacteroidota bacterium]MBK9542246.1 pseudaminic acid synthase [Bacteroidota bacterium]MBP6402846.1 pseudaminic acid synthase [Bacteroidia bacterium]MBP6648704.1 pseudaminic acid synthase [Bacteroidia bacterium]